MRGLVSRLQPPTHSRTTRTLTDSSPVNWNFHVRPRRGLVDVVSGVVHDASGVVHDVSNVGHDVGHVVGDIATGKPSKLPGDVAKSGADVFKAGVDAGKGVTKVVHSVVDVFDNAVEPPGTAGTGHGSGGGDPNHGSGSNGGTQSGQGPHPTPAPGSGGGQQAAQPVSSQAPSSATSPASSALQPSEYSEPTSPASIPLDSGPGGAVNAAWPSRPSFAQSAYSPTPGGGIPGGDLTIDGVAVGTPSTASTTQLSSRTDALPSNDSGGGGTAHRKGFPLAAAAAIGSVLGFLVVSALFWAIWLYLRKRRRAFYAVFLPPKRMLSVTTARTVSTIPLFISASEAGVKDENPFRHPHDAKEEDPFDAASLWRSSTTRSASTLSV